MPRRDFVVLDEDLREDRLVQLSPHVGRRSQIETMAVRNQSEGCIESLLDGSKFGVQPRQASLRARHVAADPLLLTLEQVERYRPGVMGQQQLLAFLV